MSGTEMSANLARNLAALREAKNMSQRRLSELADIPRSTLTHIESGDGNPTLENIARLSSTLGVGIEELLARPRSDVKLFPKADIPVRVKGKGAVQVYKLLPERVRGLEIDRMELEPRAVMKGTPHTTGTKEYMHVLAGTVTVLVAGEIHEVATGDVFAFPGDQGHSYLNRGKRKAVAISVVVPVPVTQR